MRPLGPKSFPELLKIFDEENSVKDRQLNQKETWPRDRFKEANSQFGEWNEFELSHAELLDVKLIWNVELLIPKEGMTVANALLLPSVREWTIRIEKGVSAESHIWLASEPLRHSSVREYGYLKDYEGHLIPLDGLHRLLAWGGSGKQTTLAFIAGRPPKT